jgi:hypothetical protein
MDTVANLFEEGSAAGRYFTPGATFASYPYSLQES